MMLVIHTPRHWPPIADQLTLQDGTPQQTQQVNDGYVNVGNTTFIQDIRYPDGVVFTRNLYYHLANRLTREGRAGTSRRIFGGTSITGETDGSGAMTHAIPGSALGQPRIAGGVTCPSGEPTARIE